MTGQPSSSSLDDLLEEDLFRTTRTDVEMARLVRRTAASTATPHAELVHRLLGADRGLAEDQAREIWVAVLEHRRELARALGRAVNARVAAFDWLTLRHETDRPVKPLVVSRALLRKTVDASRRDALTGLPNRERFVAILRRHVRRLDEPIAIAYLDLDGFKAVNDELGHARGDEVLASLATSAADALRVGDVLARIGGDEFALLLPGAGRDEALAVVARLRRAFERANASLDVSFSAGVALAKRGERAEAVVDRADRAMYRDKRLRRRRAT